MPQHPTNLGLPADMASPFRYWAFISYAHVDAKAAARLHRHLESYRLPKALIGTTSARTGRALPERLYPIFRDREELGASSSLGDRLQQALRDSSSLIVVCSPNAVRSRWVDEEVRFFKSLGRESHVFCLIIEGEPNAEKGAGTGFQECFVPSVRYRITDGKVSGERIEPIAADARPGRDEAGDATLKLVAGIAGVEFDALKQRDLERGRKRRLQITATLCSAVFVLAGLTMYGLDRRDAARDELQISTARRLIKDGAAKVTGVAVDEEGGWQRLLAALALAPNAGSDVTINDLLRRSPLAPKLITAVGSTQIAISPRGDRLATGSPDGTLRMWDANSGLPLAPRWKAHADPATRIEFNYDHTRTDPAVTGIAFSTDGSHIATSSSDSSIRIWDARRGTAVGDPLRGHRRYVAGLIVIPKGEGRIASIGDTQLSMWDARVGKLLGSVHTQPLRVFNCIAVSPDGTLLATCGPGGLEPGTLHIWNATDGTPVGQPWRGHKGDILAAAFSPDGRKLVSAGADSTLLLWDVASGRTVGTPWRGHSGRVESLAFSPDGTRVVSSGEDMTLRIWDASNGTVIGSPWFGHKGAVTSVRFAPDGARIYSGSIDGTVRVWPSQGNSQEAIPFGDGYRGSVDVFFSADGTQILTGGDHRELRWRDVSTGSLAAPPITLEDIPVRVFAPDMGRRSIHVNHGSDIKSWDAGSKKWTRLGRLPDLPMGMRVVALSPDAARVVVTSALDEELQLWDVANGTTVGPPWKAHNARVLRVIFTADGTKFISCSEDGTAAIWDSRTGAAIGKRLRGHTDWVADAAFSANADRVVSASRDGTLRLWDGRTGESLGPPWKGHVGPVNRVAWGRDESIAVSGGDDGTLRLWDVASGSQLGDPWVNASHEPVSGLAMQPNGMLVASSYDDGSLRLWPAPKAARAAACSVITQNMSIQHWTEWVSVEIPYRCQCDDLPVAPDDPNAEVPPRRCADVH